MRYTSSDIEWVNLKDIIDASIPSSLTLYRGQEVGPQEGKARSLARYGVLWGRPPL